MMSELRTMIIVWKWEDLDPDQHPIDPCFPVKGISKDKLIRINQHNSESFLRTLTALIEKEMSAGQVLAFLHRDHGFSQLDVNMLLDMPDDAHSSKLNCFLFGGGNDYIYFSTYQAGLLDDFGSLINEPEYDLKCFDATGNAYFETTSVSVVERNVDKDRWEVLPVYFNNVWNYYQYEVKRKLFELKEDFFRFVLPFYLADKKFASSEKQSSGIPLSAWKEEELLLLRITSFCGLLEDKGEYQRLRKYERATQRALIFENYGVLLKKKYGPNALHSYQKLRQLLADFLPKPLGPSFQSTASVTAIRETFDQLLNAIPEPIYS